MPGFFGSERSPLLLFLIVVAIGVVLDLIFPAIWFQRSGALSAALLALLFAFDARSSGKRENELRGELNQEIQRAHDWSERVAKVSNLGEKSTDPADFDAEEFVEMCQLRDAEVHDQSRIIGSNFRSWITTSYSEFEAQMVPVRRFKRNEILALALSTLVWGFGDLAFGENAMWR